METLDDNNLVFMAVMSEQAERYEEMAEYMKRICYRHRPLNCNERNLLSVAFKNLIGAKRAAFQVVCSMRQKLRSTVQGVPLEQISETDQTQVAAMEEYFGKVRKEVVRLAIEVIELLAEHLMPFAEQGEPALFYLKMTADYYRYLGERDVVDDEQATKAASENLSPTHPIRIGMACSLSSWSYEILNEKEKAIAMAKSAFDEAVEMLDELTEGSYKETTLVLQILRNNITLWTSELEEKEDNEDEVESSK